MNVLITRRASLSPWREKRAWWYLQSGCRQSRSNKRTNRNLHQRKRSEDGPLPRPAWWDWCDDAVIFTKKLLLEQQQLLGTRTCTLTYTLYLSVQLLTVSAHNWRVNNTFTVDSQKHSHTWTFAVYIYATVGSGIEQFLELQGWICKIQSDLSQDPSDHTQCIISQTFFSFIGVTGGNLYISGNIHSIVF